MKPSRQELLDQISERALSLPEAERADFVHSEVSDPSLRAELLALLAISSGKTGHLQGPTRHLTTHATGSSGSATEVRLEQIGPYRVERLVGSGGMGRVYLARLEDQSEPVAIKVLRSDLLDPEVVRRFAVEQSFLAGIDHPNIARLIDAGTIDPPEGAEMARPFFVMEFIEGRPIDRYCTEAQLDLPERLELFRKLCAAVHFAHQNLVVHRDIKPGNILVTPDGEPKLLDFGIAKFLDPSGLRWSGEETAAHVRLFTPDYASPEQVLGEPITTSTDVYSLGAVLYLLLTGKPYRRFEATPYSEMVRAISETTPERPSTVATRIVESDEPIFLPSSTGWRRRLRGDLDAIVMKALRREPEQRYPSAVDLADDLGRHLDGQPVMAHRGGWQYRAGKFVRRHRVALGVAAAFLAALLTFSWVTARARDRAELEAARAHAINLFLRKDLLEAADPRRLHGADVTMKQVLDAAAERIAGRFDGEPLIEADIRFSLGSTYHHLGSYEEAEPHLRLALTLREGELGKLAEPTIAALAALANLQSDRAAYDEAMTLQEEAARRVRAGLAPDHPYRLSIINNLASLYSEQGRTDEAETLYREVLDQRTRSLGADDQGTIVTAVNLARLLARTGREAEGLELLEDSLDRSRRTLGAEHPYSSRIAGYLASLYNRLGRYEESESLHRQTLESQLEALGERHPDTLRTRNNLGAALVRQGKDEAAYPHFQEVLAIRREIFGPEHPATLMSIHNLAGGEISQGRYEEAVELSREACEIARANYPEGHFNRHLFESRLGAGLVQLGDLEAAMPLLLAAYEPLKTRLGPSHPGTRAVAESLVELYRLRGDEIRAEEWRQLINNDGTD